MHDWLISFVSLHPYLFYAAVIALACAEGPILSVFFGVMIRAGYFDFFPVYAALMAGDLIGDVIWYYLGFRFGRGLIGKFGRYIDLTEDRIAKVTELFHKHKDRILVISKLTNGFGFALVTLVTSGIARIPFRRYMVFNAVGQLVWSAMLIGAGYFFGHLYSQFDTWFGRASVIAGCAIILLLFRGYRRYLQKKVSDTGASS